MGGGRCVLYGRSRSLVHLCLATLIRLGLLSLPARFNFRILDGERFLNIASIKSATSQQDFVVDLVKYTASAPTACSDTPRGGRECSCDYILGYGRYIHQEHAYLTPSLQWGGWT